MRFSCVIALLCLLAAPARAELTGFRIEGELIDAKETVEGFLQPLVANKQPFGPSDEEDVKKYLYELGYHTSVSRDGSTVVLTLKPVHGVRHVVVDVGISVVERIIDPVFSEELQRRMTLRPGAPLEPDKKARRAQLDREAERLTDYLRSEGYYEAVVTIIEVPRGKRASQLRVGINPGPAYTIGKLRVAGNSALRTDEITEVFRHFRLGVFERRFSRDQMQKDIERVVEMYQRRGFPGVRVSTDFDIRHSFQRDTKTVEFTIEVRERRKVDVVFNGLENEAQVPELEQVLTINKEGSYDDFELRASAEEIRRYYQRDGKYEANVTWERVGFGVFERLTFNVSEGRKLPVHEVLFRGNTVFTADVLEDTVKTQKWQRFIIGESGGYLTDVQLIQDMERILDVYAQKGYRETRITPYVAPSRSLIGNSAALAASIAARTPSDGLTVLFLIEEGAPSLVEEVRFAFIGSSTMNPKKLATVVETRPGQPLIDGHTKRDAELLRRYYFSNGFPRAVITSETVVGTAPHKRIVLHKIMENDTARIGKLALRGNYKTKDWVVRDEVEFKEGQLLTVGDAERAQSNLRRSGLFSSVRLDYQGLENPKQKDVNLLVTLQELHDNVGELQTGFGYATDTRLFSEVGYRLQNIGGIGARLDLRGVLGQERQSIDGKLVFPRWIMRKLTGTPFLLELSSFLQVEDTRRFGDLTSVGSSIAATKQGTYGAFEGVSLGLRYDFRRRNRDQDLIRTAGASDDIDQTKQVTISSTIGPQLIIDKRRDTEGRRNPLAPSRGFFVEARVQFGEDSLVGSNRFVKLGTSGQHFLRLGDYFMLTNAVRYDQGFPLHGDSFLPDVERFFAGGDTTVRGFEEDRLATEIIEQTTPPAGGLMQFIALPAGGNIRFVHNLELQVKVWRLKFPIASAIFFDTGIVTNSLDGFEFRDLRHSVGIALARMVLPFGSLSLEYAVPLDPQLGDNPQGRFHMNIGLLF